MTGEQPLDLPAFLASRIATDAEMVAVGRAERGRLVKTAAAVLDAYGFSVRHRGECGIHRGGPDGANRCDCGLL